MKRWGSACIAAQLAIASGYVNAADVATSTSATSQSSERHYEHNGVIVDFSAQPAAPERVVMEGAFADVRFKLKDAATGQPLRGNPPGAWLDMAQVNQGQTGAEQKSCKDKVALYLKGVVGIRPMVDLTSYFVVLLNKEPSISVVDPLISLAGATSTFATIALKQPGEDWTQDDSQRRIYVTLPKANEVAIVNTDNFTLGSYVDAGVAPTRVALQPDKHYVWVGNDAADAEHSGVTVIDASNAKQAAFIATGAGHHEIAFSSDSRRAFVTNRGEGTVSAIDIVALRKLSDIKVGSTPLAAAYSTLSHRVYVSDGKDGEIAVIDANTLAVVKRVAAKPGIGPMAMTLNGRYALTANPATNTVYVIDTASNELLKEVSVEGQPYQLAVSESYVYVRALASERVTMIDVASLAKGHNVKSQSFAAGAVAPKEAGSLAIANSMAVVAGEGSVYVVNPVDANAYYYREGMNAPSSGYKPFGASARAVTIADRSLREVEPGVYQGRIKVPVAGKYDVAFMLDSPQILHCFAMEAKDNPRLAPSKNQTAVEFSDWPRKVKAGQTLTLRFKLLNPATGEAKSGVRDMHVMYFLAPGAQRTQTPVKEIGGGVYELKLTISSAGAYYIYPAAPSMKLGYGDLQFFTLLAEAPGNV